MFHLFARKKKKMHLISKLLRAAIFIAAPFLTYKTIKRLADRYDSEHDRKALTDCLSQKAAELKAKVEEHQAESEEPTQTQKEQEASRESAKSHPAPSTLIAQAVRCFKQDTTEDGEAYTSTTSDENVLVISAGAQVTITHAAITSSAEQDSADLSKARCDGVGAAILATDGTAVIQNAQITTGAAGAAGVFARDDGVVRISDTNITTADDCSDALRSTNSGMIDARQITVETSGEGSSVISCDGDGSILLFNGGTGQTNGSNSPAVFCDAEIAIHQAELTAAVSEAVRIKGSGTLNLFDTKLTSAMTGVDHDDILYSVAICSEEMSDEPDSPSVFTMTNGSIEAKVGGIFYAKRANAEFYLNNVAITTPATTDFFLRTIEAETVFTAENQQMEGNILTDRLSCLDLYLRRESCLKGAFLTKNTHGADERTGKINVYIDSESTWIVTGDSILTNLFCVGKIHDPEGRTVRVIDRQGNTCVRGTSHYKVTVDHFETIADFSGAGSGGSFTDFSVQ